MRDEKNWYWKQYEAHRTFMTAPFHIDKMNLRHYHLRKKHALQARNTTIVLRVGCDAYADSQNRIHIYGWVEIHADYSNAPLLLNYISKSNKAYVDYHASDMRTQPGLPTPIRSKTFIYRGSADSCSIRTSTLRHVHIVSDMDSGVFAGPSYFEGKYLNTITFNAYFEKDFILEVKDCPELLVVQFNGKNWNAPKDIYQKLIDEWNAYHPQSRKQVRFYAYKFNFNLQSPDPERKKSYFNRSLHEIEYMMEHDNSIEGYKNPMKTAVEQRAFRDYDEYKKGDNPYETPVQYGSKLPTKTFTMESNPTELDHWARTIRRNDDDDV